MQCKQASDRHAHDAMTSALSHLSTMHATSFGVQASEEQSCAFGHSMLVTSASTLLCTWPCKQPWQYICVPLGQHVAWSSINTRDVPEPSTTPPQASSSSQHMEHLTRFPVNTCSALSQQYKDAAQVYLAVCAVIYATSAGCCQQRCSTQT